MEALINGATIPPLWLVIGGIVAGFVLARRFPAILPGLFKPASAVPTVDEIVKGVLDKLNQPK